MAHFTWTYVDDTGRQHHVGLFHGNRNAHLMIYVNMKVMTVDFNVRDSKRYSFFIEDEFCEIVLERRGEKMYYHFEINKKVDTPRNRDRKKRHSLHLRQTLLLFGGMVAIAFLIALAIQGYKANQTEKLYGPDPNLRQTEGRIEEVFFTGKDSIRIKYRFYAGESSVTSETDLSKMPTQPYLPLAAGQYFKLNYDSKHPYRHELYLNKPTDFQVQNYVDTLVARQLRLYPDLSPEIARCQIQTAFQERGLRALAIFYFQKLSPEENKEYNSRIYEVFINSRDMREALAENCGISISVE